MVISIAAACLFFGLSDNKADKSPRGKMFVNLATFSIFAAFVLMLERIFYK